MFVHEIFRFYLRSAWGLFNDINWSKNYYKYRIILGGFFREANIESLGR